MKTTLQVNTKQMRSALRSYARVSARKSIPSILNQKTPFVITRAMKNTPKTTRAAIASDLGTPSSPSRLALRIVSARAIRSGKRLKRGEAKKKAGAMIRARMGAIRYVSLGWLKPLSVWRSVKKPLKSSSLAAKGGYGIKATAFRHETRFANAAPGAYRGESALVAAINQEASSTAEYARKKLQKLSHKYRG